MARILVLYEHSRLHGMRATVHDHLRVLDSPGSPNHIIYFNALLGAPGWLRRLKFDVVILHTLLLCRRWDASFGSWKKHLDWVGDLACLKIAVPQDEYNHSEILDEWLHEWGVSVIFSNFDAAQRRVLYPIMHDKARFYECFTGYISEPTAKKYAARLLPGDERRFDIVYRAKHVPYWFGSHGQLKHRIADVVAQAAKEHHLRTDISTHHNATFFGERWIDFLASGRTVLGVESGSSVLDRRGEIQARIRTLLIDHPELPFEALTDYLPAGWDSYHFTALGPRNFEAVITQTCQVLVKGAYGGVLKPDTHYIPLEHDFSNLPEVLEKIKDPVLTQSITERAYNDIYLSDQYTYRQFREQLEEVLPQHASETLTSWIWGLGRAASRLSNAGSLSRLEPYVLGYEFLNFLHLYPIARRTFYAIRERVRRAKHSQGRHHKEM
jgi:hypothetical protein